MTNNKLSIAAAIFLVVGGVLGMVGSFVSPAVRGIAWGLDGTALVIGTALLAVHYIKRNNELLGAAFIVYVAGQTLVDAGSAMSLAASSPTFGAGAGLWAAALVMIAASSTIPVFIRVTAAVAGVLFAITAIQIFGGAALTPLSKPLPFNAYPVLVITLFGLAWMQLRPGRS